MNNKIQAIFDGFVSTADLIGTLEGYLTKNPHKFGYVADKFSLAHSEKVLKSQEHNQHVDKLAKNYVIPSHRKNVPYVTVSKIERTIDEQILKGVGDVIGLAFSVGTAGLGALWFYTAINVSEMGHKQRSGGSQQHYRIAEARL